MLDNLFFSSSSYKQKENDIHIIQYLTNSKKKTEKRVGHGRDAKDSELIRFIFSVIFPVVTTSRKIEHQGQHK